MSNRALVVIRDVAFVLRCSGAATATYLFASTIGLSHPVWACISSVIVAQEKLKDTNFSTLWRLGGTVTGVVVAILSGSVLDLYSAGTAQEIACAVAICAVLVRKIPDLKVAVWTAPIVFVADEAKILCSYPAFPVARKFCWAALPHWHCTWSPKPSSTG